MFYHSQELITGEERARLEKRYRHFFGSKSDMPPPDERSLVDVYEVSIEGCYVLPDFNEELPLYLLDIGGIILILFGQWMFDPHTTIVPREVFETWDCEHSFFESFFMRCLVSDGFVFQLAVRGTAFVEAQRLPSALKFNRLSESQFVAGHGATLVSDLEKAGLIQTSE